MRWLGFEISQAGFRSDVGLGKHGTTHGFGLQNFKVPTFWVPKCQVAYRITVHNYMCICMCMCIYIYTYIYTVFMYRYILFVESRSPVTRPAFICKIRQSSFNSASTWRPRTAPSLIGHGTLQPSGIWLKNITSCFKEFRSMEWE